MMTGMECCRPCAGEIHCSLEILLQHTSAPQHNVTGFLEPVCQQRPDLSQGKAKPALSVYAANPPPRTVLGVVLGLGIPACPCSTPAAASPIADAQSVHKHYRSSPIFARLALQLIHGDSLVANIHISPALVAEP